VRNFDNPQQQPHRKRPLKDVTCRDVILIDLG